MRSELQPSSNHRVSGLVDVLDRVLDKGLAIAGDIKISLAEVELLTIRIRLIICSIDKAQEIGLDWWKHDRHLAPGRLGAAHTDDLSQQLRALERKVALLSGERPLTAAVGHAAGARAPKSRRRRAPDGR
ncbi:MAG TPA: gas vesicle protein [Methylomirabilota bacterium]|nr:gas vesicle protein [Methylomirabilota bacterium]